MTLLCEVPLPSASAWEDFLFPDLNPEQPFSIRAALPEGGSVGSEPLGQFIKTTQVSACCMQTGGRIDTSLPFDSENAGLTGRVGYVLLP